jgi:hypothetical protein
MNAAGASRAGGGWTTGLELMTATLRWWLLAGPLIRVGMAARLGHTRGQSDAAGFVLIESTDRAFDLLRDVQRGDGAS